MRVRTTMGLVAAAALVALSACGSTKPGASTPASTAPSPASPSETPGPGIVVHIDLVNGKAATEPKPIVKVRQGDTFTLIATSDKPAEIHIHGYDLKLELTPGQATTKSFVAAQQGTFEVEIEDTSTHLFNLQVE